MASAGVMFSVYTMRFDLSGPSERTLRGALGLSAVVFAIQFSFCFAQTNSKPGGATARPMKPETPHLEFVTEYIRELAAVERIRAAGEAENNQDTKDGKLPFGGAIHTSTLFELELRSQVKMLRGMHLSAPFDELIPNITGFYEQKILLWRRIGEISSVFIAGPQDGVDYGKLAAEMPRVRGQLDYVDQSLFEAATSTVFATLINMGKEDSKGHASHLIITNEEKHRLISELDDGFGQSSTRRTKTTRSPRPKS